MYRPAGCRYRGRRQNVASTAAGESVIAVFAIEEIVSWIGRLFDNGASNVGLNAFAIDRLLEPDPGMGRGIIRFVEVVMNERCDTPITTEHVIACAANQRVISGTTKQLIVIYTAVEIPIASTGYDQIVAGFTVQAISIAIASRRHPFKTIKIFRSQRRSHRHIDNRVGTATTVNDVVTSMRDQYIVL